VAKHDRDLGGILTRKALKGGGYTGSRFTGATAVRFGAAPAASFTVDSDTQTTAVSPPLSA